MTRAWYAASGVCALVGSCVFKRGRARVCVEDNFKNKLNQLYFKELKKKKWVVHKQ